MWVLGDELRICGTALGVFLLLGLVVVVVLLDNLFNRDALELGLALSFDALDLLVVREVLEIFGMVVGLVCLRLRGGVKLLCRWERVGTESMLSGRVLILCWSYVTFVMQEELCTSKSEEYECMAKEEDAPLSTS